MVMHIGRKVGTKSRLFSTKGLQNYIHLPTYR